MYNSYKISTSETTELTKFVKTKNIHIFSFILTRFEQSVVNIYEDQHHTTNKMLSKFVF